MLPNDFVGYGVERAGFPIDPLDPSGDWQASAGRTQTFSFANFEETSRPTSWRFSPLENRSSLRPNCWSSVTHLTPASVPLMLSNWRWRWNCGIRSWWIILSWLTGYFVRLPDGRGSR